MRIAFVTPTAGDAFGQERVLKETCALLKADGHQVFLLAEKRVGELPPNDGSVFVEGITSLHSLSDPRIVRRRHANLMRSLREFQPDVVHFFDQFDFRLMTAVAREFPSFLSAHTVAPSCPASGRLIPGHASCEKKSGWACVRYDRQYHCLSFCKTTLHRYHAVFNYLLRRRALMKMRGIIAISDYVRDTLVRDGYPAERVWRLYNPVPLPTIATHEGAGHPKNLIVCAARLVSLKGIDWLIRALKPLESLEWTLWILGDGPERESLAALVDKLGLRKRIVFQGRKPFPETRTIMAASALVAQTNVGPEGFGLSVAEASALEKPVVAFDIPALNEVIEDGKTGMLVPLRDLPALSDAIYKILTDTDFARRLGKKGRERVAAHFSPDAYLRGLLDLYRRANSDSEKSELVLTRQSA